MLSNSLFPYERKNMGPQLYLFTILCSTVQADAYDSIYFLLYSGPSRGGRGQITPELQAPKSLITPNASRSGGPHKGNQQYFSKINF